MAVLAAAGLPHREWRQEERVKGIDFLYF